MYYAKKMRTEIENKMTTNLAKILEMNQPANEEDIRILENTLEESKIFDKRGDYFSRVIVGLPTREFTVRYRSWKERLYYEPGSDSSSQVLWSNSVRREWKFYFTFLTRDFSSKGEGVYSLNQFTNLLNAEQARNYKLGLKNFKVQKIEISGTALIIAIKPQFHFASLGILAPSTKDLESLFRTFER
jgi:hypothetical protein